MKTIIWKLLGGILTKLGYVAYGNEERTIATIVKDGRSK